MFADRAPHGVTGVEVGRAGGCRRAVEVGDGLVWQGTSVRNGGGLFGSTGWTPSGAAWTLAKFVEVPWIGPLPDAAGVRAVHQDRRRRPLDRT